MISIHGNANIEPFFLPKGMLKAPRDSVNEKLEPSFLLRLSKITLLLSYSPCNPVLTIDTASWLGFMDDE